MTDKRRPGWLGSLVADPWRKLAALGLAALLWYFVDSRINQQIRREMPLVFVGAKDAGASPSGRLAVALPQELVEGLSFFDGEKPITKVAVTLSGPRFRIAALERESFDLLVSRFRAIDWKDRSSAEFSAADLDRDQFLLRDVAVAMTPASVRIEVAAVASRKVALALDAVDLVEGAAAGRWRRDSVQFTPAEVQVLGRATEVDALARRTDKPFRAELVVGADDRQATAKVELVDAERLGIRFASQPVLTVQLRPRTAPFELEVPIVVDDRALPEALRGRWLPEAQSRIVRVQAGGDLRSRLVGLQESVDKTQLADWVSENLRLHVHVPRPATGVVLGPEIDLKARLLLLGPLSTTVDRNECLLDEVVVVKLRQKT